MVFFFVVFFKKRDKQEFINKLLTQKEKKQHLRKAIKKA